MQHDHLDHSGDVASTSVEHLDLGTAELRRRIAGIGLAIAELREETGRLRASADRRYHAVAVLDRPRSGDVADATGFEPATPPTVLPTPLPGPSAAVPSPDAAVATCIAEPVSPWRDAPVTVIDPVVRLEPVSAPTVPDAGAAAGTAGSTLTWVPETDRIAAAAPDAAPTGAAGGDMIAASPPETESERSLWADDEHDAAAFDAFFSAEIEPEPSQRWLLSD